MHVDTTFPKWDAEFFTEHELACPCKTCGGKIPTSLLAPALKLAKSLDVVRRILGVPIAVVSGIRCREHNKKAGGKRLSRHLFGDACDIQTKELSGLELKGVFEILIKLRQIPQGGLGTYKNKPRTLHYDQRPSGAARWRE